MSDIKWIKITTNMFEDEKIRLIDAMPERDTIHYVWIRLLVQAGKTNAGGFIFLNENIPYTDEMLATIFSRPLTSIRLALKTLVDFQMIEIGSDNIIKILNWDKHQNIEGMERVRAQNRKRSENYREKKKQIEKTTKGNQEEEKQNNDNEEVKVQEDYEVKVQEDQGENTKVNAKDNENIVHFDNSEPNSITKIVEDLNDNKNTNESLMGNIDNNNCDMKESYCNVTKNKSNVTVTEQNKNKRESKRESKNKNKREIESKNKTGDINNKGSTNKVEAQEPGVFKDVKDSSLSLSKDLKEDPIAIADDLNAKAIEIMTYYEKITGVIGGINYGALRLAIDMHGAESVKMAINKALEVNQTDMRYINGILKNWRREGYPNQREEINNGSGSTGKSNRADKNEFTGFKPKESRKLTEAERKEAQEGLI